MLLPELTVAVAPGTNPSWFRRTRIDQIIRGGGDDSNNASGGAVRKENSSKSNSPDGGGKRPTGKSKAESPMLREWNSSYHRHEYIAVKYPAGSTPGQSAAEPKTGDPGKNPPRQS